MFLFIFLLPAFQAVLFCAAIGRDPTSLKMAIVNDELDLSQGRICNYTTDCVQTMLSCRYLRFIDNTTITQVRLIFPNLLAQTKYFNNNRFVLKVPYQSLSDAMDATRNGHVWGVVHFRQNFTDDLLARHYNGVSVSKQTIADSQIGVTMDFSSEIWKIFKACIFFTFQ